MKKQPQALEKTESAAAAVCGNKKNDIRDIVFFMLTEWS